MKVERGVAQQRPPADRNETGRALTVVVPAAGVGGAVLLGWVFVQSRSPRRRTQAPAVAADEGHVERTPDPAVDDDLGTAAPRTSPIDDPVTSAPARSAAKSEISWRSAIPVQQPAAARANAARETAPPVEGQRLYERPQTQHMALAATGVVFWRGGRLTVTVLEISDDVLRCELQADAGNEPLPKPRAPVGVSVSTLGDQELTGRITWRRLSARGHYQFGIEFPSAQHQDLLRRAGAVGRPA